MIAANGYAQTTNKAIAEAATVDLASINYHFGSRQQLYQTVLASAHSHFVSLPHLMNSNFSARDKLAQMIEGIVAQTGNLQSWQAQVLARELLAPSIHLGTVFKNELQPKLKIMMKIISEITDIPIGHPALLRCLLSVGGPCLMLMVAGQNTPGPLKEISQMP